MDDQEITLDVVQQLNDDELSDLLKDEAGLELSLAQVSAIRQFIKIAGDLDSALELVNSVKELKDAAWMTRQFVPISFDLSASAKKSPSE